MDPGVVIVTEEDQIVDDGLAVLRPGNTVMNVDKDVEVGRSPPTIGDSDPSRKLRARSPRESARR